MHVLSLRKMITNLLRIAANIRGVNPPLDLGFGFDRYFPIKRCIRFVFCIGKSYIIENSWVMLDITLMYNEIRNFEHEL